MISLPLMRGDQISSAEYLDNIPVNLFPVEREIRGAKGYLQSYPALVLLGDSGQALDRGALFNANTGKHLRVSGNTLYSIDATATFTAQAGAAISGTGQAVLDYSFNSTAIVADGNYYRHDASGNVTEITAPAYANSFNDVAFIDGYYFFTDGEVIFHSTLADETAFDPNAYQASELSPDPTVALDRTPDSQLIVFDRFTTNFFVNRATANFAFSVIRGKSILAGIMGRQCYTLSRQTYYILGGGKDEDPSIHILGSSSYQRIATRYIDKVLRSYTDAELASAVLESRVKDGDEHIIVRLPRDTLSYNATIGRSISPEVAWTRLASGIEPNNNIWIGANGIYDPLSGSFVYGSVSDGRLFKLDDNIGSFPTTEDAFNEVESVCYTPFIDLETASIDQLEIDTISGFQIADDNVNVSVSATTDGEHFGREVWLNLSKQRNKNIRLIARRLGYVDDYVAFRIRSVTKERLVMSRVLINHG